MRNPFQALSTMSPAQRVLIVILMLIAFNLRMAFNAADPLLGLIAKDLHLSSSSVGLFAIIPVLCLGLAAICTPIIADHIAPRKLLLVALFLAFTGILIRSFMGLSGLYVGMFFLGTGLGIAGTIIIPIIKQAFPLRATLLMAVYVAIVSLGSSFASYTSDWFTLHLHGWRWGLAFWDIPLSLALVSWWLYLAKDDTLVHAKAGFHPNLLALIRDKEAWYVTFFYLFRVASAYLLTIWVSTLMRHRGLDTMIASHVFAIASLVQIPASLTTPFFSKLLKGGRNLIYFSCFFSVVGFAGLLYLPVHHWVYSSIVLGWSIGILFSLGMQLMTEKTSNEAQTLVLSSMSQGIAFIVGGMGAFLGSYIVSSSSPLLWAFLLYVFYAGGSALFGYLTTKHDKVSAPASLQ